MKRVTLIILTVAVVVILVIIGRFYFSDESFSTTNPFWDSIGQVVSLYRTYDMNSLTELSGAGNGSMLLVIGPSVTYTDADAVYIRELLQKGGRVVVMDDNGTANTLLNNLKSPITINPVPLCQNDDYFIRPSFPVLKNFSSSPVVNNVSSLVLNHPVSLIIADPDAVIASTSVLGWLDVNDNCAVDEGERFSSYPVIASVRNNGGELIVIGDPDLVTNGMLDKGDNRVFIRNLLGDDAVYVDMTHGHEVPPLARVLYVIRTDIIAQFVCVLLILITGYIYYKRTSIVRLLLKPRSGEEDYMDEKQSMVSYLRSKFLLNEHEVNEINKKL